LAKKTALQPLPHPESEHQWSLNNFCCGIFGNPSITQILELITKLLSSLSLENTKHISKNTDFKIINIAICKSCKKSLLDVENTILITYYSETAKTRVLYESTDEPTGQPAEMLPNSDEL